MSPPRSTGVLGFFPRVGFFSVSHLPPSLLFFTLILWVMLSAASGTHFFQTRESPKMRFSLLFPDFRLFLQQPCFPKVSPPLIPFRGAFLCPSFFQATNIPRIHPFSIISVPFSSPLAGLTHPQLPWIVFLWALFTHFLYVTSLLFCPRNLPPTQLPCTSSLPE